MKLADIAKGWYQYLKADPATRQRMDRRLKICEECPNKKQVTGAGKVLLGAVNSVNNLYRCGLCNCPLGSLASLPRPACKAGKWTA